MGVRVWCFSFGLCCLFLLTKQCPRKYPFEHYLAVRTPYRFVSNSSLHKVNYEGCIPKKVWMLVRHGTRNPSKSNLEPINSRLPIIKNNVLNSKKVPNDFIKNRDLDLFKKWKWTVKLEDEKKLTHEGEDEMLLMAERMQSRFPEVFENVYSNTTYKFKYTFSQRTKKSAFYFAAGLFGKKTAKDVWFPDPIKADPILRFYKLCKKWKETVKAPVHENGEHKKFQESPTMAKVASEVTERLGLTTKLNVSDIYTMYITCGFETAWNKRPKSPWCSPFTEENLKALEYIDDLKHYWQDGYGYQLTYQQACPAFGDLINYFNAEAAFPKVTVYFTHSGTLLKMLAHMGLYRDQNHLTASEFGNMANRKWKTGLIDSFGTNLAFILYECDGVKKVLTMHQENIIKLPCCPESDLCEYEKIYDFYSESIESCDFDAMCDESHSDSDSD
ncbi:multiple inositol polyphosphate phosphatase 1 [Dendroctonus ponderosae]